MLRRRKNRVDPSAGTVTLVHASHHLVPEKVEALILRQSSTKSSTIVVCKR
jgi:hypothetical protein